MNENILVVDHKGAMERLDNDQELWDEIRAIWVEDAPAMLQGVRDAFAEASQDGLRRAAHALKGASSNVGATRVAEAARILEAEAMTSPWDSLSAKVAELESEVERAKQALAGPLP
jgi:two-component system sensor histidine kinase/response regulator